MATIIVNGTELKIDNPEFVRGTVRQVNTLSTGSRPAVGTEIYGTDADGRLTWIFLPPGCPVLIRDED